jgi:uncharacterized protein YdeI (YjbR/CyaY-like superfamily)
VPQIPSVHPKTRAEWRAWLTKHHATELGVWFVYYKSATGKPRVTIDGAVEEALCFGWIDSMQRSVDAERTMLRFSPRKPKSGWSKVNKERVRRLTTNGLMTAPGLAKIAAAKRDGSWRSLDAIERLEIPTDLEKALAASAEASRHFAAFPPSSKKIILTWIANAKRPETRAKRVAETVRQAAKNLKANHYRQ